MSNNTYLNNYTTKTLIQENLTLLLLLASESLVSSHTQTQYGASFSVHRCSSEYTAGILR